MNRMFYLSIVYDADGYDRLDLTKRNKLQDLDEIMSEFNNKDEVSAITGLGTASTATVLNNNTSITVTNININPINKPP